MFTRYPYQGWLIIVLLLWLATSGYHYTSVQEVQPDRVATLVSRDLQKRMTGRDVLLHDTALTQRIFNRQLTESDLGRLLRKPYYVHAWEEGALVFWSNNLAGIQCNTSGMHLPQHEALAGRSIFFTRCDTVSVAPLRVLSVTVPVAWLYPFENRYLRSHWVASDHIPPLNTKVSANAVEGFHPVYHEAGKVAFYMSSPPVELPYARPDKYIIWTVIAMTVAGFFWIHLVARHLSKKYRPHTGLFFLMGTTLCTRAMLYIWGLPFNLGELELFTPQLYASSRLLPSLGDLLLNTLIVAWWSAFLFTQTAYRTFIPRPLPGYLRYPFFLLIALSITACTRYAVHVIRSVVTDSMISFDVSDFYAIDGYSIVGLVVIVLTASTCAMLLHILNVQFTAPEGVRNVKYVLIIVGYLLFIYIDVPPRSVGLPSFALLLWVLLFIGLLDLRWLQINRDLLSPRMILWAVFISSSTTVLMYHFNHEKERETRKLFAAKLLHQKDPVTEYLFIDITRELSDDARVRSFLKQPNRGDRKALRDRIELLHLKGHLSKYQSDIYLYNAHGQALYNDTRTPLQEMEDRIAQATPVGGSGLYFIENSSDNHYYLARIPILEIDSTVAGFLFIDMSLKKESNETVYPELLQPEHIRSAQQTLSYDHAIYYKQQLVTQSGYYAFPLRIARLGPDTAGYVFEKEKSASLLWYQTGPDRYIVVLHHDNPAIELTTMFSYLFSMVLLLMLTAIILNIWFSYTTNRRHIRIGHISLRRRIHYGMLSIVLISFLIIGVATITFFNNRYQESGRNNLRELTRKVEASIREYLDGQKVADTPTGFESATQLSEFRYLISSLANQHGIDINIFNNQGALLTSSRNAIYDKQLLAPLMRADAYQGFQTKNSSLLLQQEQIGALSYLAGYVPFQNKAGATIGYINVPYYTSQEELRYQISNILVALINLYAFILLISSLLAVIITNNLTRSLHMIIGKFKHLNLQQNELIDWPYDDEIGLLVREYNKMVQKVETHALMLAQNERESAWREMARQVAHEIKNPLTPMKLNIQYLQQALRAHQPDVQKLTSRISNSLIEQIDNLSYIASEFSNFAKMPEARPEVLELNEIMERTLELYLNKDSITVVFHNWQEPLRVFIDKSQLLRVCTNLLQNAIQAIPEDRNGRIEIVLGRERQHAMLSVRDNGNGIAAAIKEKIFTPYFTTKSSGTGLGLAMTRKIIEFWKGSIWFETEEGQGTVFYIRLPLSDSD